MKLFFLAVTLTVASASIEAEWFVFKQKYNKTYVGDEDVNRRSIWQSNLKSIEEHNELYAQGKVSFYMGENEYTDMSHDEFVSKMNGLRMSFDPSQLENLNVSTEGLPASVDWRTKGYVTPVKNQGRCGSCWAFSATGSLEGAHFKSKGKLVSLSESNLVDCSTAYGNEGCNGGYVIHAFDYVIHYGLDTESSYHYVPRDGTCKKGKIGTTAKSYTNLPRGSEYFLMAYSAEVGPISVAIDASLKSFQRYAGGVYSEPSCSSVRLDHAVLVVGYGEDDGIPYWLVKNSWGTSWGERGYIKMSRNKNNQCGIATDAIFPIV